MPLEIVVTVPESQEVTAEEVLDAAAKKAGWDPAQKVTAAEYFLDRWEAELYGLFLGGRGRIAEVAARTAVPPPVHRGRAANELRTRGEAGSEP